MKWNASSTCEKVFDIAAVHQCDFLRSVPDCENNDSFVNYLEFLYCAPTEVEPGWQAVAKLVVLLVMLFFLLGATAGEFLCPNLVNISRALKMSQSDAGVTLLAFGNGAPDVVSTLAGVNQNRSALVIAELYGGAMYICTIVIGLLFVFSDFNVPLSLFRDVLFYLAASFWALLIFRRGYVQLSDSLGFLGLHLFYLLCAVIIPRMIEKFKKMNLFKKVKSQDRMSSDDGYLSEERLDQFNWHPIHVMSPSKRPSRMQRKFSSSVSLQRHLDNAICSLTTNAGHEIQERISRNLPNRHDSICEANLRLPRCPSRAQFSLGSSGHQETSPLLHSDSTRTLPTGFIYSRVYSEWQEFIMRLWPIESAEWRAMTRFKKVFHVVILPLLLPLLLTVPLVDDHLRRSNWNRPLSVFQCLIDPLVLLVLTNQLDAVIHGFPLWAVAVISGCVLALILFATSFNKEPPRYHVLFSFIGFFVSLAWIFRLATEVVSILKTFGIYFNISEEVLGVSVLTWGNYLGDLVTNLSVASQGYPQMALSACLSTSLVAILIGFGSAFTSRLAITGESEVQVRSSGMQNFIYLSLLGSMIILVSGVCIAKFQSSRALGFLLVAYYFLFLLVISCEEFGLLRLVVNAFTPDQ